MTPLLRFDNQTIATTKSRLSYFETSVVRQIKGFDNMMKTIVTKDPTTPKIVGASSSSSGSSSSSNDNDADIPLFHLNDACARHLFSYLDHAATIHLWLAGRGKYYNGPIRDHIRTTVIRNRFEYKVMATYPKVARDLIYSIAGESLTRLTLDGYPAEELFTVLDQFPELRVLTLSNITYYWEDLVTQNALRAQRRKKLSLPPSGCSRPAKRARKSAPAKDGGDSGAVENDDDDDDDNDDDDNATAASNDGADDDDEIIDVVTIADPSTTRPLPASESLKCRLPTQLIALRIIDCTIDAVVLKHWLRGVGGQLTELYLKEVPRNRASNQYIGLLELTNIRSLTVIGVDHVDHLPELIRRNRYHLHTLALHTLRYVGVPTNAFKVPLFRALLELPQLSSIVLSGFNWLFEVADRRAVYTIWPRLRHLMLNQMPRPDQLLPFLGCRASLKHLMLLQVSGETRRNGYTINLHHVLPFLNVVRFGLIDQVMDNRMINTLACLIHLKSLDLTLCRFNHYGQIMHAIRDMRDLENLTVRNVNFQICERWTGPTGQPFCSESRNIGELINQVRDLREREALPRDLRLSASLNMASLPNLRYSPDGTLPTQIVVNPVTFKALGRLTEYPHVYDIIRNDVELL